MAKKTEPIILNKEELMPTNLGSMKQKESGLITTVIILIVFGLGILFLPNIMEMLNPMDVPPIPYTPSPDENDPNENPGNEPTAKTTIYELKNDLEVDIQGYTFSEFIINKETSNISFKVKNNSGAANYFSNHPYYIEYYSTTEELLGRTKIEIKQTTSEINQSYEINNILINGEIAKIAIKEIIENEYPAVTISNGEKNMPMIVCSNGKHNISYTFQKASTKYVLKEIEEIEEISSSTENYEEILEEYNDLNDIYNDISGVQATISPTVNGFEFSKKVDLEKISETNYNSYFKKNYYYKKNTDAKVISFELQSSNYICK